MRRSNLMCGSMLSVPRASPLPGTPADPWAPKRPAAVIEDIKRSVARL